MLVTVTAEVLFPLRGNMTHPGKATILVTLHMSLKQARVLFIDLSVSSFLRIRAIEKCSLLLSWLKCKQTSWAHFQDTCLRQHSPMDWKLARKNRRDFASAHVVYLFINSDKGFLIRMNCTTLLATIALLMSAPTESVTAASEVLSAALQNAECLDDAKESTLDKGEAVQYVLDNPPPELKRLRNLESVIETSLRITSNQFTIGRFLPRGGHGSGPEEL